MRFSFSTDHSTRDCGGGGSKGGKSIDNGLEDKVGDVLIHPFDCGSGDKRHVVDDGGVTGIHIGASGDKDDEGSNNGTGRLAERARNKIIYVEGEFFRSISLHPKAVRAGV